jgi:L-asparaginase II
MSYKKQKVVPRQELLAEIVRYPIPESTHCGHVAAVDGNGNLVAQLGDFEKIIYLRSACKPHQAIPLVTSGAADHFEFSEKELALVCGSHNGEPAHTDTISSMLQRLELGMDALKCGVHEPYGPEIASKLRANGEQPSVLHHNCSGKHVGMLAMALHMGAGLETYYKADHPVQIAMKEVISLFAGVPVEQVVTGIDGCGVPTFGVSVQALALMFVRLRVPCKEWDRKILKACLRIVSAMQSHPEMVEGLGEIDTEVIRHTKGRVISKVGAEGVYAAGISPCAEWPNGLGVAFKIEDGDSKDRARSPVIVECLRQLGVLREEEIEKLTGFRSRPIYNTRNEQVGIVRPSFSLNTLKPHRM